MEILFISNPSHLFQSSHSPTTAALRRGRSVDDTAVGSSFPCASMRFALRSFVPLLQVIRDPGWIVVTAAPCR